MGFMVIVSLIEMSGRVATAQTMTWTGVDSSGGAAFWSNPLNWTNGGGSPPGVGNPTEFGTVAVGASKTVTSFNVGDQAQSMTFSTGATDFTFQTDNFTPTRIALNGNLSNLSSNRQRFNLGLDITGAGRTISNANNGSGGLTFNRSVTNTGNTLTVSNANTSASVDFTDSVTGVTAATVRNSGAGFTNYQIVNANGFENTSSGQVNVSGVVRIATDSALTITKSGAGSIGFNGAVVSQLSAPGSALRAINVNNNIAGGTVAFNSNVTASTITTTGIGTTRFGTGTVGSAVTVGAGGKMDGVGTITGLTTIAGGANYSAGAGVGVVGSQTLSGGLTFDTNGANPNFTWDLVNGTGFDSINLAGSALNIGSNFVTQINLSGTGLSTAGETVFDVFRNMSNNIDVNNFGSSFIVANNPLDHVFSWRVSSDTSGFKASIVAVPEPSSMALIGMAGLIGVVYARRRAKKNQA
jgi:hypothetical protein